MLIGTDPEFFLFNETFPIPAIGLLGGTKGKAKPILDGVGIQEDNVMGELTISPVSLYNPNQLHDLVHAGIEWADKQTGFKSKFTPSAKFTAQQLADPMAQEFGCARDWNVYERDNHCSVPILPENTRFAGGHIHFGDKRLTPKECRKFTKILDLYLAMPAIRRDKDKQRRKAYGKPGNFRYKPYGMEYRTVSNWWLGTEEEVQWVFKQIKKAVAFLESGKRIDPQDQTLIYNSVQVSQYEPKLIEKYDVL